jgi:peptidyl-prolyl cis-trans isomerase B (cyclophilin B)
VTPLSALGRRARVLLALFGLAAVCAGNPIVAAAGGPAKVDPIGWRPCAYLPSPIFENKDVGTPPAQARMSPGDIMTIVTNRGIIKIKLFTDLAPCTVNSFRFLASKKYFDGTHCHRLTTSGIFVLQCGDPFGNGSGAPGYMYQDENLVGATYPAGTVAMANAGPDTNGSQFFICYKDSNIKPMYTPFGVVLGNGLNLVRSVAAAGSDNSNGSGDGHPKRLVKFTTLRLSNAS